MVHGDPKFGECCNQMFLKSRGPITVTLTASEDITMPAAKGFRDQLGLMDMNSIYGQAYLANAVQRISRADLKYLVDAELFLDFVETAMRGVVMSSVEHLLHVAE